MDICRPNQHMRWSTGYHLPGRVELKRKWWAFWPEYPTGTEDLCQLICSVAVMLNRKRREFCVQQLLLDYEWLEGTHWILLKSVIPALGMKAHT